MGNFKDQSLSLSLPDQFATLPHWMEEPSDRALLLGLLSVLCLVTQSSVLCLAHRCTHSGARTGVNTVPILCGGSLPRESGVQIVG